MNDNSPHCVGKGQLDSAEAEAIEYQEQQRQEFEEQEAKRFWRRQFVATGDRLMEDDRTWFKWQLAVWAEQIK
jgi:hypothetical protein